MGYIERDSVVPGGGVEPIRPQAHYVWSAQEYELGCPFVKNEDLHTQWVTELPDLAAEQLTSHPAVSFPRSYRLPSWIYALLPDHHGRYHASRWRGHSIQ